MLVVDGWEQAYFGEFSGAGGGEGERPIVSYATSPVAEVVFAEEPPRSGADRRGAESCYRQVEFAGVLAGTDHRREARAVIDFLLSRRFQEDVPLRMFVFPVVGDAELPRSSSGGPRPSRRSPCRPSRSRPSGRRVQTWTDLMLG